MVMQGQIQKITQKLAAANEEVDKLRKDKVSLAEQNLELSKEIAKLSLDLGNLSIKHDL